MAEHREVRYATPSLTAEEQCEQDYIALLNACHDVYCTGCGWCEWTGMALYRQLEAADGR